MGVRKKEKKKLQEVRTRCKNPFTTAGLVRDCSLSIRNPLKDAREELPRSGLLARFAKFTSTSTALIRA